MMRRPTPLIIAGIATTILVLAVCAFAQQNVGEMYQRARMLDESNQNLTEAIRLYKLAIAQSKGQRVLAARAEYRIGVLYERMGRTADAQRAFKTVASQYPDQVDLARRANARIPAAGANGKQTENAIVKQTGPSADGWYLETFTFSSRGHLVPAIDTAKHRLYTLISNYSDPGSAEARQRGARQGLHPGYEPSTLVVIDTESSSVVRTIRFSVFLTEIAFNPANNKLYAAAQLDGHIKVIDTSTFAQTRLDVRGLPTTIAVNATTNKIYVTSQGFSGNDKLFEIDGSTDAIAGPYDLGGVAGGLVVNSATNRIYAFAPPNTRVFNGADNSVVADLPAVGVLEADLVHNVIYAMRDDAGHSNIQALDGNTHSPIASFEFASYVKSIAIAPESNRLYVPLPFKNQIAVVDLTTRAELGRLIVGETPQSLAIDSRTGYAYVCHTGDAQVIGVLDTRSLEGGLQEEFSEPFDSPMLDPNWKVIAGQGSYSLVEDPGHLRFRTAVITEPKPRLLLMRRFRGEQWILEVKASYFPGESGGSRSLIFGIFFGAVPAASAFGKAESRAPLNVAYILRSRDDWNGCCPGETRQLFLENGKAVAFNLTQPNHADTYVWRIDRNGRTVTIERSDDGINFTLVGTHNFGPQIDATIQYLGIGYDTHANNDAYADYDYVRLTKNTTNQH